MYKLALVDDQNKIVEFIDDPRKAIEAVEGEPVVYSYYAFSDIADTAAIHGMDISEFTEQQKEQFCNVINREEYYLDEDNAYDYIKYAYERVKE